MNAHKKLMNTTNPPRKKVERKFKPREKAPPPLRVHPLQRLGAFTVSAVMAFYPFAGYANPALPTGAEVIQGGVTIGENGQVMNIDQTTAAAIVNWQTFNIGLNNSVNITQPASTSTLLSRVMGGDVSDILGSLQANGHFYLVNPAGIYFGQNATIDTGALIASTLDITDEDFMAGRNIFSGVSDASIINEGVIRAHDFATLLAKIITNTGTIEVAGGTVALAARSTTLDFDSVGGSKITIDISGLTGGDVINTGYIETSGAANEITDGGAILIDADRVGQFGQVHADGAGAGHGGMIRFDADSVVALDSDSITTANAGANGDGGEVIAFSPGNALFRDGASIEAKGGSESGDGGYVDISGWEHAEVYGSVSVDAIKGEGGTFLIDPFNITIRTATAGGTILPDDGDPFLATADDSEVIISTLLGALDGGGNTVNITTADGGTQDGDITVVNNIDYVDAGGTTSATLNLNAADDIILGAQILDTGGDDTLNVGLFANATNGGGTEGGGTVQINNPIDIGGTLTANGSSTTIGADITAGGLITFTSAATAGASVTVDGLGVTFSDTLGIGTNVVVVDANGGTATFTGTVGGEGTLGVIANAVSFTTGNDIATLAADIESGGLTFADTDALTIGQAADTQTVTGINTNSTLVDITAPTGITVSQAIAAGTGAAVTLTADSMAINAAISSTGALLLQPSGTGRDIRIGTTPVPSTLDLTPTEVGSNRLTNGFSSITIGRANSTATMTISDNISIADDVVLQMGGAGGRITSLAVGQTFQTTTLNDTITIIAGSGSTDNFGVNAGYTIKTNDGVITINANDLVTSTTTGTINSGSADTIVGSVLSRNGG